jgi:16S rRNA (guanine527-N7)-methyltransferase
VKRGGDIPERATTRLQELVAEHGLDAEAAARLLRILRVIASDPRVPTSVTDPAEAVDVHVADSLSALPLLDAMRPARVADIGSGAGFPGIALAVARPQLEVDLVESAIRKCLFMEDLTAGVGLERVKVVHSRVEEWGRASGRGAYDAVVVRALGTMPMLLEYAAPLLREDGVMVAWKTEPSALPQAAVAADALGMELDRVVKVEPYAASRDRHLHLYRRVRPVPEAYPRRPGMARKRPLGGS